MRKTPFYYALLLKFGTMEAAAKALGTKRETLLARATGEADMPYRFTLKAAKALGIENNTELIEHIFF